MEWIHNKGKNKGKVILYALSTCVWCNKTKQLLTDLGIEFSYIYVDKLSQKDIGNVLEEVRHWNPACSFPVVVINDKTCIIGFREKEIREALKV